MIHHYVRSDPSGDHWGVSWTGELPSGRSAAVLAQLQNKGELVRLDLSADQAEFMAEELRRYAKAVRGALPLIVDLNAESETS